MAQTEQDQPKYMALGRRLATAIEEGSYGPGDRLPGELDLVGSYGVSRGTARQAMQYLEERGLVDRCPGRGTFVSDRANKGVAGAVLKRVTLLLIDRSTEQVIYGHLITALQELLSREDVVFTVASVSSADLMSGSLPSIIDAAHTDGLILTGVVQAACLPFIEALGLPSVVLGNYDLPRTCHQVRVDFQTGAREATGWLASQLDAPVFLLVEPFALSSTRDMLAGYSQAVRELPQRICLVQPCPGDDARQPLRDLIAARGNRFTVLTTDRILSSILHVYTSLGLTAASNPIAVIGHAEQIPLWRRSETMLVEIDIMQFVTAGLSLLRRVRTGRPGETCIELPMSMTPALAGSSALQP